MTKDLPPKDPDSVEPYFVVWCDEDGTNDGTADDSGELQGETINTSVWTGVAIAGSDSPLESASPSPSASVSPSPSASESASLSPSASASPSESPSVSPLKEESSNKDAVTIAGITYDAATVATIWLSGGTDGVDYDLLNEIITTDFRTLQKTITVMVRSQ